MNKEILKTKKCDTRSGLKGELQSFSQRCLLMLHTFLADFQQTKPFRVRVKLVNGFVAPCHQCCHS